MSHRDEKMIASLRQENSRLEMQIQELTHNLANYEIMDMEESQQGKTSKKFW